MRALILAFGLLFTGTSALAHSGGTDSSGCHTDHKTGDYHCHKPKKAPAPTPVVASAKPVVQRAVAGPTCHTGPRGGTYTITASGRKNYSGC